MPSAKNVRVEATMPQESYELLKRAAEISGASISSFISTVALDRSRQILAEHAKARYTLNLDEEQWKTFEFWMQHPEIFREGVKKALQMTKGVKIDYTPSDLWNADSEDDAEVEKPCSNS